MSQESICKDIDISLQYKSLPAHMTVKDFIQGEESCNYEAYLMEFLNASSFFLLLSGGEKYKAPISESNNEPDAISKNYELDFKLMCSTSKMEADSLLSSSITKYSDGVYGFGSSKVKGERTCTRLCAALRYKKVSDFIEIDNGKPLSFDEKDIKKFLKILRTKKNILLFLPVEFLYFDERSEQDGITGIQQAIGFDLKASIEYREIHANGYDTYVATTYNGKIIFFKLSSREIEYIDSVDQEKSDIFMKLYDCGSF